MEAAAPWWFRGPARREGEWIIFDATRAESYDPSEIPLVGIELAKVGTPDEALKFVQRYGLLVSFRNAQTALLKAAGFRPTSVKLEGEPTRRERIDDILDEAEQLYRLLRSANLAQHAGKGDAKAAEHLSRELQQLKARNEESLRASSAGDLLALEQVRTSHDKYWSQAAARPEVWWTETLCFDLSQKLASVRPRLKPAGPGKFDIQLMGETLLDFCYLSVAHALAREAKPLAICPECSRVFVVVDGRQKFCEPKCAGKARFRKFVEKRTADSPTPNRPRRNRKEIRSAKKTSTRRG